MFILTDTIVQFYPEGFVHVYNDGNLIATNDHIVAGEDANRNGENATIALIERPFSELQEMLLNELIRVEAERRYSDKKEKQIFISAWDDLIKLYDNRLPNHFLPGTVIGDISINPDKVLKCEIIKIKLLDPKQTR